MQLDPDEFAEIVANAIKVAIAPLVARIAVLERREAVPGPEGKPGRDGEAGPPGESVMGPTGPKGEPGQDADAAVIKALETQIQVLRDEIAIKVVAPEASMVRSLVAEELKALPMPRDGQDGTSVTLEDVAPLVKTLVADAVADLPAPKDGASVTLDDVEPLIEAAVRAAAEALPVPKDGQSVTVEDVAPLIAAEVQKAVAAIPVPKNGKDGVGLTGAFQSREGTLIITLSDGSTKDVGTIVGRDVDMVEVTRQIKEAIAAIPLPKDGRDGLDGVGFDDLELVEDDKGRPILRCVKGDKVREFRIDGAYCGVWKAGESYLKGDRVTWSGSLFIARQDTTDKPETSAAWQLAVKHGKEGKPGPEGQKGIDGRHGRDGKDLTYLDPSTGRKY